MSKLLRKTEANYTSLEALATRTQPVRYQSPTAMCQPEPILEKVTEGAAVSPSLLHCVSFIDNVIVGSGFLYMCIFMYVCV